MVAKDFDSSDIPASLWLGEASILSAGSLLENDKAWFFLLSYVQG